MEIFDHPQGSAEWFQCRLGIPTASNFATVLAKGKGGAPSKTRRTYMLKLAGEIITGEPSENFSTPQMQRGNEMEAEARELYAFRGDVEPVIVGFVKSGQKGCSPDALIGADGMLEIKTKRADLLIDALLSDSYYPEHTAQCQGQLWVTEREWVDLAVYWPGLPLHLLHVLRDDAYIQNLSEEIDRFNGELAEIVDQIRRKGPTWTGRWGPQ